MRHSCIVERRRSCAPEASVQGSSQSGQQVRYRQKTGLGGVALLSESFRPENEQADDGNDKRFGRSDAQERGSHLRAQAHQRPEAGRLRTVAAERLRRQRRRGGLALSRKLLKHSACPLDDDKIATEEDWRRSDEEHKSGKAALLQQALARARAASSAGSRVAAPLLSIFSSSRTLTRNRGTERESVCANADTDPGRF